jgi:hypothetical protein
VTAAAVQPAREALIREGHHPLAFCEFCGRPVPTPLADCPDPDCQQRAIAVDMYFVRLEDA